MGRILQRKAGMKTRLICTALAVAVSGCAALEQLRQFVQAPRFEQAEGQRAEIRLVGPRADLPIGGAAVRLWTHVTNPNSFGLTLGTLKGTLYLQGTRAADADFPLGLPLRAGEDTVVPIDLSISFADLPGLADVIRRAIDRQPLPYRFDGTIGVDAGRLGTPVFGPMTLMTGDIQPVR
jgi:late embryogenesis abundant protein